MGDQPQSFDTRGFFFALKCFACVLIIGAAIQTGASVFANTFTDSAQEQQNQTAAAAVATAAPVPVTEKPATPPSSNVPLSHISAKAFLIADLTTGTVYASRESDTPHPIASISKLLTALTVSGIMEDEAEITVTETDRRGTEGSPGTILRTDTFPLSDILYPLLMESNNSVANAIARTYGKRLVHI